jgi:hypothetical protein
VQRHPPAVELRVLRDEVADPARDRAADRIVDQPQPRADGSGRAGASAMALVPLVLVDRSA